MLLVTAECGPVHDLQWPAAGDPSSVKPRSNPRSAVKPGHLRGNRGGFRVVASGSEGKSSGLRAAGDGIVRVIVA